MEVGAKRVGVVQAFKELLANGTVVGNTVSGQTGT